MAVWRWTRMWGWFGLGVRAACGAMPAAQAPPPASPPCPPARPRHSRRRDPQQPPAGQGAGGALEPAHPGAQPRPRSGRRGVCAACAALRRADRWGPSGGSVEGRSTQFECLPSHPALPVCFSLCFVVCEQEQERILAARKQRLAAAQKKALRDGTVRGRFGALDAACPNGSSLLHCTSTLCIAVAAAAACRRRRRSTTRTRGSGVSHGSASWASASTPPSRRWVGGGRCGFADARAMR